MSLSTTQIPIHDCGKPQFCTLCTCTFHIRTFHSPSRSFDDVKSPVLQLCGRQEHAWRHIYDLSCDLWSPDSNLISGNFKILRTHFPFWYISLSSIPGHQMILLTNFHFPAVSISKPLINILQVNREVITETRSYIFRWFASSVVDILLSFGYKITKQKDHLMGSFHLIKKQFLPPAYDA